MALLRVLGGWLCGPGRDWVAGWFQHHRCIHTSVHLNTHCRGGDVNMILPATTFGTLKSVINLTKQDLLVAIKVVGV